MARQTRSEVAGMSIWSMPSGASASRSALMIVCGAAMHPAWPEPLTPSGLAAVGNSARVTDRRRNDSIVDELDLDNMGCCRECCLRRFPVSTLKAKTEISWRLLPERSCARLQRRRAVDDCGQRPIFDDDAFRGVTRRLAARCYDQRDRIADMTHPPPRQRVARRHDHRTHGADLRDTGGADAVRG
jgi:hypothetical protein